MCNTTEVGTMTDAEWEVYMDQSMELAEQRRQEERADIHADLYGDGDDFEELCDHRQW